MDSIAKQGQNKPDKQDQQDSLDNLGQGKPDKLKNQRNQGKLEELENRQLANANTYQGRENSLMDIDRMVNEGLGGGQVTLHNGLIGETTTDTMFEPDSFRED